MLDFFQTVRSRHSIRRYQPARPVPREHLHAILETASAAPSAGDRQLYRIAVAENGDALWPHTEGKAGVDFRVIATVTQDVGMHHAAA